AQRDARDLRRIVAERVGDGIGDGGRAGDRRAFARALDAEWIERRRRVAARHVDRRHRVGARGAVFHERAREELAARVVDDLFGERGADALPSAASAEKSSPRSGVPFTLARASASTTSSAAHSSARAAMRRIFSPTASVACATALPTMTATRLANVPAPEGKRAVSPPVTVID